MTDFTKISDLSVASSLSDNDKFIVETSTGTKACTRSALREAVQITKEDVGLGNCDNTSDLNKPISTATQTALNAKVDTSTYSTFVSTTLPTTYLSQTDAASTYLAKNTASGTYLSKTDAANYYITQESAGSLFVTQTEAGSILLSKTEAGSVYATKTEATQNITTNTFTVLATTTKTVTGAINELNTLVSGVETLLSQI